MTVFSELSDLISKLDEVRERQAIFENRDRLIPGK